MFTGVQRRSSAGDGFDRDPDATAEWGGSEGRFANHSGGGHWFEGVEEEGLRPLVFGAMVELGGRRWRWWSAVGGFS